MKYTSVACGGTFDHLHSGHKAFLEFAFSLGKTVTIGVTSDRYVEEFKIYSSNEVRSSHPGSAEVRTINLIEPFVIRKKSLEEYLNKKGVGGKFEIISIDDPIGPAGNSHDLEALVVTDDTKNGAEIVNKKRIENGLKPLVVEVFEQLRAEDGRIISSTRIRNGKINREGKLWVKKEWLENNLQLPQELRETLKKPLGKMIYPNSHDEIMKQIDVDNIVTVGDVTTKTFLEEGIIPHLSVVDFLVERKMQFLDLEELGFSAERNSKTVKNPPGMITKELFEVIKNHFDSGQARMTDVIIIIDGEEDLAVLPIILSAPLGFQIFYGQPEEGMVQVVVDENKKEEIYALLEKFTLL